MNTGRERTTTPDVTWFLEQLGDGWTTAGDGIYYPPEPRYDVPEPFTAAVPDPVAEPLPPRLPQRRRELMRLRERLVERVARFPNPVIERQLQEMERELAALARRLGPFHAAHPT